jgi:hypothetical protein
VVRDDKGEEAYDTPKFPDDGVTAMFEGVAKMNGEVTTGVVVGRGLFVLGFLVSDGENLWALLGEYVLIFCTRLFRCHARTESQCDM